jgi:hypothetical protein
VNTAGLLLLLALLGVIVGREVHRVRAIQVVGGRARMARRAELALWAACLAIMLPRLIGLLT